MKQISTSLRSTIFRGRFCFLLLFLSGIFSGLLHAQTSYTFTSAGATGSLGPTQAQLNTAYAATNLNGSVTTSQGIQQFIVPLSGGYRIQAFGAQGGGAQGGKGAMMSGDFTLTAGQVLNILVGQSGQSFASDVNVSGGGGSYVISGSSNILMIAGGGGGSSASNSNASGTTFLNGQDGLVMSGTLNGPGGTSGNGGAGASCRGGGGAGWLSGGGAGLCGSPGGQGGLAFLSGGYGGGITSPGIIGGFGGGGSSEGTNAAWVYAGGGGGYSGGGASSSVAPTPGGGGGGSINNGINQANVAGANAGNGVVIITSLCNVSINGPSSICSGSTIALSTNAVGNYLWSTGNTTSSVITVAPNVTTTYTVSGTGTSPTGCTGSAMITVTVSAIPSTMTLSSSTNSTCLGNTVSVSAGGALSYTFSGGISNGVPFTPPLGINNYTVSGTNGCGTTTAMVTIAIYTLQIIASASFSVICAGSPATLTAVGASSYTWLPGSSSLSATVVSPLSTTVYTVNGTLGNCSATAMTTITTLPTPTLSISASPTIICSGDQVNLSVAGNALTYTWNPGGLTALAISDTPANTTLYSVSGTNSLNCVGSTQQVVLVDPTPTVHITPANPMVCVGGTTALGISGSNSYTWSNGVVNGSIVVSPTVASNYTLFNTSALGCISAVIVVVGIYTPSIAVSSNTSVCNGATISIGADIADSYLWSSGQTSQNIIISPTVTTVYSLTAMVNNLNGLSCQASDSVLVMVNQNPTVTVSSSNSIICVGETATLIATGAGPAGTYTYTGGESAVISPSCVIAPVAHQTYTVTGADTMGCKSRDTYYLLVSECLGISVNTTGIGRLQIYPNPSSGELTVSGNEALNLSLMNAIGQHLENITLDRNTTSLKLNLPQGVYFISGTNENGSVKQKIVIAK